MEIFWKSKAWFERKQVWAVFNLNKGGFGECALVLVFNTWKKGKDPHPQDKSQHLDFTKDPRPLYYKTPPCVFYHENVCSKAVFGP